jgi:hypothetical protein
VSDEAERPAVTNRHLLEAIAELKERYLPEQWKRAQKLTLEWPITLSQALGLIQQCPAEDEQEAYLQLATAKGWLR